MDLGREVWLGGKHDVSALRDVVWSFRGLNVCFAEWRCEDCRKEWRTMRFV